MFHNNAITLRECSDFLSVKAVSGGEFGHSPVKLGRLTAALRFTENSLYNIRIFQGVCSVCIRAMDFLPGTEHKPSMCFKNMH